ncbi:MAG: TonB-dependent receptor [Polyangiaceae bacterium]|nr:TonB-dependent receptor [Polyangiaceae bacterium]
MKQKPLARELLLIFALLTQGAVASATDTSGSAVTNASTANQGERSASDGGSDDAARTVEVVGAPLHPHALPGEPAISGSVVRREDLEAPGLQAADVLRRESGVEVAEYGGFGSAATASVRGATAEQTPVYLAGIRLNDEVGGAVDLSTVPLWLVDRVEIYRGNAPIFADELGIGGAIAFEPRRPEPGQSGAGVTIGSFGSVSGFSWAAAGSQSHQTLVGIQAAHADNDYPFHDNRGTLFVTGDDRAGRQSNGDVSILDAWFLDRVQLNDHVNLNVVANVTSREQGVVGLALLPTERARARYARVLLGVSSRAKFGPRKLHSLRLATSFTSASSVYEDPESELSLLAPRVENAGQRGAQKLDLDLALSRNAKLVAALDASVDRLERRDGDVAVPSASAVTLRGATGLDYEFAKSWFLSPLGALSCRRALEFARCDGLEPVGRVAVSHRTEVLTTYASAARYVRFPSLGEVHGVGLLVRGNSHLLPESGVTAEIGTRLQVGTDSARFWADADVYSRSAERLVSYVRNAQGYLIPINVQAARVQGVETAAGADLGEHLSTDLSLTLLDARDTTPDRRITNDLLPFHSRLVGALGVEVRTKAHSPGTLECTKLRASSLYQSSRYADPAGLVVIPQQFSVDLELEQGFLADALKARGRIANVLGSERFDRVGYPLPQRSFFVSMEMSIK